MNKTDATAGRLVEDLREVVHEMNNALTPITANAQLARLMIEETESELGEILEDVVEAAGRASRLAIDMRGITRSLEATLSGEDESGDVHEGGVGGDGPGH
ncbi:MAG: hypothetical protein KJO65_05440 [Gemmatimonadetes bacterium]|nr:hypothetical protein [Gemmatimonadota bacterium]